MPEIKQTKRRGHRAEDALMALSRKLISETDTKFIVRFTQDNRDEWEPEILAIPGARFEKLVPYAPNGEAEADAQMLCEFSVPKSDENMQTLAKFGRVHKFDFDSDIAVRAQSASGEGKQLTKLSYALRTGEIDIPKLGCGKAKCPICNNGTLLPFQPVGVDYLLRAKRSFLADDPGAGKTVTALAGIAATRQMPWIIVCPANLRYMWLNTAKHWLGKIKHDGKPLNIQLGTHDMFVMRKGRNRETGLRSLSPSKESVQNLKTIDILIVNYDRIKRYREILATREWAGVVFDESHYLKASKTQRGKSIRKLMLDDLEPEYVWDLTGTPAMNKPEDLINQLRVMRRLPDFGGVNNFIRRYCSISSVDADVIKRVSSAATKNGKHAAEGTVNEDGLTEEQQDEVTRRMYQNCVDMNAQLRSTCYIRREISDVLPDLPEKTRSVVPLDIDNRKLYEKIEKDTIGYLIDVALRDKKFMQKIAEMPLEAQQRLIAKRKKSVANRNARAEAIIRLNKLKKTAALGKLKAAIHWIEDFIANGQKLVVFCHHHAIRDELIDYFGTKHAVNTRGNQEHRENAIARFQNDPNCLLFIGSLKRDGVGITLTAASTTVTLELFWNPAAHDQAESRVHRIGSKHTSIQAIYLVAANTVEEKIAKLIEDKRYLTSAVIDGDPLKGKTSGNIYNDLIKQIAGDAPKLYSGRTGAKPKQKVFKAPKWKPAEKESETAGEIKLRKSRIKEPPKKAVKKPVARKPKAKAKPVRKPIKIKAVAKRKPIAKPVKIKNQAKRKTLFIPKGFKGF